MLPHSHSNATARYMSHTHPACTRQHAGHTHASTWSSLPGKLEERNTHRQRGHLPTGTEHWTGQSTTQSPIQICSTELFFPFLAVSNTSTQRRQPRERETTDNAAMKCRRKKWRITAREKEQEWKKKESRMRGRDVSFLHSGHPVWQRRRNLLRQVLPMAADQTQRALHAQHPNGHNSWTPTASPHSLFSGKNLQRGSAAVKFFAPSLVK